MSADDARALFKVSPAGNVLAIIPNTATVNGCEGLESVGERLICTDTASGTLLAFSQKDGTLLEAPMMIPSWEGTVVIADTLWVGTNGFTRDGVGLTRGAGPRAIGMIPLPVPTATSRP